MGALTGASLVVLCVVSGRAIVETQAIEADTGTVLVAVVSALVALAAMLAGPVVCLAALVGLGMMTFLPSVAVGGGVDLKPADVFYVALLGWGALWLLGPRPPRPEPPALQVTPIVLFVGFAGLTILYVATVDPSAASGSFLSWLRLVQTLSIAVLAAIFLRSTRDVGVVLGAVAVAGTLAVALALIGGVDTESDAALGSRGGGLNPNTLGLVAGLLMLMGFLGGLGPRLLYRIPLAIVGALGLIQSQSVGALVGTCVALTLGLVLLRAQRPGAVGLRTMRAAAALVVALGLAYGLASAIRPENLPHSDAFESSSAWHRTLVGAAGLEVAVRNPIIGVGWRRSSSPEVIGDPEVTAPLRERFAGTKEEFFPDVQPASVHNTYVQIAAELGLVGLALLGLVLYSLARDIRRLVRRLPPATMARRQVWYLGWGLVLILVWLNDNPLYGGQPETVALAAFVGAVAGLGQAPRVAAARAIVRSR